MITHIDITGIHYDVDDLTKKYVMKKIGRLDRFTPRHARKTLKAEVVLKQVDRKGGNKYECDINLILPGKRLNAKDTTLNMLAAVDIVEQKLKMQLKKYHDEHVQHNGKHNLVGKMKRRMSINADPVVE